MPYPIAHLLFAATVIEACLPQDTAQRGRKVALGSALGLIPDFDFGFVWLLHWGRDWHRGFTHSIGFALAAGALCLLRRAGMRAQECVAFTLALLSHCVLDLITTARSPGVELLWPLTAERYRLALLPFLEPRISGEAPGQLLAAMLRASMIEAALLAPVFILVWLARRHGHRRRVR